MLRVADGAALPGSHPAHGKGPVAGAAAAYVCRTGTCGLPVTDPAALPADPGAAASATLDETRRRVWPSAASMPHLTLHTPLGELTVFEADGAIVALDWGRAYGAGDAPPTALLREAAAISCTTISTAGAPASTCR